MVRGHFSSGCSVPEPYQLFPDSLNFTGIVSRSAHAAHQLGLLRIVFLDSGTLARDSREFNLALHSTSVYRIPVVGGVKVIGTMFIIGCSEIIIICRPSSWLRGHSMLLMMGHILVCQINNLLWRSLHGINQCLLGLGLNGSMKIIVQDDVCVFMGLGQTLVIRSQAMFPLGQLHRSWRWKIAVDHMMLCNWCCWIAHFARGWSVDWGEFWWIVGDLVVNCKSSAVEASFLLCIHYIIFNCHYYEIN